MVRLQNQTYQNDGSNQAIQAGQVLGGSDLQRFQHLPISTGTPNLHRQNDVTIAVARTALYYDVQYNTMNRMLAQSARTFLNV